MEQKILEKYLPIIEQYASVCAGKLKQPPLLEWEDLVDEGVFVLCIVYEKFDTKYKVPFTIYLRNCLKWHYAHLVGESYKKISAFNTSDIPREDQMPNPAILSNFILNLKKLTHEQLKLLQLYLTPPEFIINEILENPRKQIEIIRRTLNISPYRERKMRSEVAQALLA